MPVVDQSEQQAVPVAQEQESALATAFYLLDALAGEGLSQTCDDGRTIEADDTVHALCSAFYMEPDVGWYRDLAAELAPLPCKSGEGAGEDARITTYEQMGEICRDHLGYPSILEALEDLERFKAVPDATQTREAELVAALEDVVRHAESRIKDGIEMRASAWRIGLEEIARDARAALNARGGA